MNNKIVKLTTGHFVYLFQLVEVLRGLERIDRLDASEYLIDVIIPASLLNELEKAYDYLTDKYKDEFITANEARSLDFVESFSYVNIGFWLKGSMQIGFQTTWLEETEKMIDKYGQEYIKPVIPLVEKEYGVSCSSKSNVVIKPFWRTEIYNPRKDDFDNNSSSESLEEETTPVEMSEEETLKLVEEILPEREKKHLKKVLKNEKNFEKKTAKRKEYLENVKDNLEKFKEATIKNRAARMEELEANGVSSTFPEDCDSEVVEFLGYLSRIEVDSISLEMYNHLQEHLKSIVSGLSYSKFRFPNDRKMVMGFINAAYGKMNSFRKSLIDRDFLEDDSSFYIYEKDIDFELLTFEEQHKLFLESKFISIYLYNKKTKKGVTVTFNDETTQKVFLEFSNIYKKEGRTAALNYLEGVINSIEDTKEASTLSSLMNALNEGYDDISVSASLKKTPALIYINKLRIIGVKSVEAVEKIITAFIKDEELEEIMINADINCSFEVFKEEVCLALLVLFMCVCSGKQDISLLPAKDLMGLFPYFYKAFSIAGAKFEALVKYGIAAVITPYHYSKETGEGTTRRIVFSNKFSFIMENILFVDLFMRIEQGLNYERFVRQTSEGELFIGKKRVSRRSHTYTQLYVTGNQRKVKFTSQMKGFVKGGILLNIENKEEKMLAVFKKYCFVVFGRNYSSEELLKSVVNTFIENKSLKSNEISLKHEFTSVTKQLKKDGKLDRIIADFKCIYALREGRNVDTDANTDYILAAASGRCFYGDGRNSVSNGLKQVFAEVLGIWNYDLKSAHMMTAINFSSLFIERIKALRILSEYSLDVLKQLSKEYRELNAFIDKEFVRPYINRKCMEEWHRNYEELNEFTKRIFLNKYFKSLFYIKNTRGIIWNIENVVDTIVEEYENLWSDHLSVIPNEYTMKRRELKSRMDFIKDLHIDIPEDSADFLKRIAQRVNIWDAVAEECQVSRKTAKQIIAVVNGAGVDRLNFIFQEDNASFDITKVKKYITNGERSVTYAVYNLLRFIFNNIEFFADIMSDLNTKYIDGMKKGDEWLCAGYTYFSKEGLTKAQIAANMFQGLDAMLAYELIAFAHNDLGLKIWSHEHDGLAVFSNGKYTEKEIEELLNAKLQEILNKYFGTTGVVYMNKIEAKRFNEKVFKQLQKAA
nr:MAG TPA: hypothetical protein [Caudoviricetes sp.]